MHSPFLPSLSGLALTNPQPSDESLGYFLSPSGLGTERALWAG